MYFIFGSFYTGLGFRPTPPPEKIDSTLIHFRPGNPDSYSHWKNDLESFLKRMQFQNSYQFCFYSCLTFFVLFCLFRFLLWTCSAYREAYDKASPECRRLPAKNCVFAINLNDGQNPCRSEFGYDRGNPCVLIKLNRVN